MMILSISLWAIKLIIFMYTSRVTSDGGFDFTVISNILQNRIQSKKNQPTGSGR